MSQRQEVLNVFLAQLLNKRGVVAGAERILYQDGERHMPDVLVEFQGLRIAIEGEINAPDARKKAIASAQGRVETRLAYIGIAVVYPVNLRQVEFTHLVQDHK